MNTSDQHSSSESSTTTMTGSTDQANAAQLEFELAWETRDEIFRNLNEHTKLLSGLIIKPDARETMRKANVDLMATLMHLPLKVDGRSRSSESLQRSADDGPTNELLLDLSSDVKSRIVDTLITNHAVLLDADFVTSQFKSKLIDRNNDLASELLKLRSRAVSINSPVSEGTSSNTNISKEILFHPPKTNLLTNRFPFNLQAIISSVKPKQANRKAPAKSP